MILYKLKIYSSLFVVMHPNCENMDPNFKGENIRNNSSDIKKKNVAQYHKYAFINYQFKQ